MVPVLSLVQLYLFQSHFHAWNCIFRILLRMWALHIKNPRAPRAWPVPNWANSEAIWPSSGFQCLLEPSQVARTVAGYPNHVFEPDATQFRAIQPGFKGDDMADAEVIG